MGERKMIIKCQNKKCGYTRDYKGSAEWYASCPRCRHITKINRKPGNIIKINAIPKTQDEQEKCLIFLKENGKI
jgi:hypothetical protein